MKQTYELEFDEKKLGPMWMNVDNLALCLYSKEHTKRDLLKVRQIKHTWKRKLGNFALGLVIAAGIAILFVIAYMVIFVGFVATSDIMRVILGG